MKQILASTSFAALNSSISNNSDNYQFKAGVYIDWLGQQSEVIDLGKEIKRNHAFYHSALLEEHESLMTLTSFEDTIKTLKKHVFKYMALEKNQPEQNIKLDTEELVKIAKARSILSRTVSIKGTLAERYLRKYRGIQGDIPKSFRFLPGYFNGEAGKKLPALVVYATNSKKQIQSIQIIFLNPANGKKASLKVPKRTYGSRAGSAVKIGTNKNSQMIAIAEGPETALSIKEARPDWTIYATLGVSNFAHIPVNNETKQILFCADNDGEHHPSRKTMAEAAEILAQKGIDIWMAMPDKVKEDFNDILLKQGVAEIKQKLSQAYLYKQRITLETLQNEIISAATMLAGDNSKESVTQPLNNLLLQYIDLEIKQGELTHVMHMSHDENVDIRKQASTDALNHNQSIKAFAKDVYKHPELLEVLKDVKHQILVDDVAKRGGYLAIRERMIKGEYDKADILALALKIRSNARSESWSRSEDQSRGGGRSSSR